MATASTDNIERIVREVLAQLKVASGSAAAHAAPSDAPPSAHEGPIAQEGNVYVDARVVTLESIAGRLQGAKQLVVPPGARVTPAVRDELRRKGVALVCGSAAVGVQKHLLRVLLMTVRTQYDPAALVRTLVQAGSQVQTETSDCMIAATDKLAAAVASGRSLGLLVSRHTGAGLCLANRHAGVRAVLATGVSSTAAAVVAVGANLLVFDPTLGTAYEKIRIVRDFCLGGIRSCPEALKERLGT